MTQGSIRGTESGDFKKLILWVDSDPVMRAYAEAVLEPTYEMIYGWDGEAGLILFRQRAPHLVVLNVLLSDMETLVVLERMASSKPEVPIILTGRYIPSEMIAATEVGVYEIVPNPPNTEHLLGVIAKALER